jgi:hypothetical protein
VANDAFDRRLARQHVPRHLRRGQPVGRLDQFDASRDDIVRALGPTAFT